MKILDGKVAVVAGATRGGGRGIARMLGEAGATVYCTGRSTRAGGATPGRPERIEETAEGVTALGGRGIPVRVDHGEEDEVRALFERVDREAGRLDVLVNSVWGGDALTEWGVPFWEQDASQGIRMLEQAVHTHLITLRHALPRMVKQEKGLVVEVTDGNHCAYRGTLYYDLVKTTLIRLAFDLSEELRGTGVTSVAVTPGFLRSEAVLEHFGVTEDNWQDAGRKDPDFLASETPAFVGRAVAALAADPLVARKNGRALASWDLAEEYGFADVDGRRPHWGRHFAERYGNPFTPLDDRFYAYWEGWQAFLHAAGREE